MRRVWVAAFACLMSGCTTWVDKLQPALEESGNLSANRTAFVHCYGHGCTKRAPVGFTNEEWSTITAVFATGDAPITPAEERGRLRIAIAQMETIVGAKAGTSGDVGGSFNGFSKPMQLDCVDEMINTATYVKMLIDEDVLVHHDLGVRLTNDFFDNGNMWPHTAMTIRETATGKEWAVDSWWLKNGAMPYIVTREEWANASWDQPRTDEKKLAAEAEAVLKP